MQTKMEVPAGLFLSPFRALTRVFTNVVLLQGPATIWAPQKPRRRRRSPGIFLAVLHVGKCSAPKPNARQALAPSSPMLLAAKPMFAMELLTFKASANAWQK